MVSTGDQASQLHHTEIAATNFEYGIHAMAPYTEAPPAFCGYMPAISAQVKLWISPNVTETVHTATDGVPTVAAIEPIENSTSAGTPLAIQNAPVQLMVRWRPGSAGVVTGPPPSGGTAGRAVSVIADLLTRSPLDQWSGFSQPSSSGRV